MTESNAASEQLQFPLTWKGRIIAEVSAAGTRESIANLLRGFGKDAAPERGRTSRKGTYVTYRVEVVFEDRDVMRQIMHALSAIEGVRTVL